MSNHVTAQITLHYKAKRPNGMQEIEQHFDQEGFGPLFRGLILRRELNPVSPARVSQRVSFATLREGHELNGLNVANVRCKMDEVERPRHSEKQIRRRKPRRLPLAVWFNVLYVGLYGIGNVC